MLRAALLGVAALASAAPAAQLPELQYGRNPSNGHYYGVTFPPTTWTAGLDHAQAAGGYLATISSAAEQTWIQGLLGSFMSWNYWIGLNDVAVEGTFVWSNGEPVTYTNWIPGQPNNGGGVEDAVEMQPGSSWRWNDANPANATTAKPLVEVDDTPRAGWTFSIDVNVGTTPLFAASGDFNGDGRPDVGVPNQGSNDARVLFGQAAGGLGAALHFRTAQGPTSAAVGDFDGDGHADFALTCFPANRIQVRYGNGLGGFSSPLEIVLTGKPYGLGAADLDGDGLDDLAATTVESQDRLVILLAAEGRTFQPAVLYATGSRPYHVTAGDLEGDGDVDLVVANDQSNDISIFRNQGAGVFTSSALYARGTAPRRIALVDLDGDGLLDMAVPCHGQQIVRLHYGTPAGGFVTGPAIDGGTEPVWTAAADLNGDGTPDLVTVTQSSAQLIVQEIVGASGSWSSSSLSAINRMACVLPIDVDGDGRTDLVATGRNGARVMQFVKLSKDCNGNARDDDMDIAFGGSTDCNGNGEPDECDLAQGGPFDCDQNGLVDACEILADPTLDLDADGILDECEAAGTPYCFGDGTGAACPCGPGQAGDLGTGCRNSVGASGRLVAVGNPSVAQDSVSLRASGLLPSAVGLFFQGNLQQQGGLGASFGDGLLCATGSVVRMEVRFASGGAMAFGRDVPGDPTVSSDGSVPAAGATRYYQVWYRDAGNYCTVSTFNLTNGVHVVWTP